MDERTRQKWDAASRTFDLFAFGEERRFGPHKRRLFSKIRGETLMVAAGTGNDFQFFPPGEHIVAIDISPKMLERAARKAAAYSGRIELHEMDVCALPFPDASFDTVATVCTFCSVPRPVAGLHEVYRVLKPGGQLLMFEHVRSRIVGLGRLMDLMTLLSRRLGPELNRDTVGNVLKAGFTLEREENVYLDVVKIIEAVRGRSS
jgi:ubiquinone/menaquinone biosynthesis C-methylase UbiE